eukprot:s4104_g6.t1
MSEPLSLLELLTGAAVPPAAPRTACVPDEALTLRFLSSPAEFGRKWTLLEPDSSTAPENRPWPSPALWAPGGGRRRRSGLRFR